MKKIYEDIKKIFESKVSNRVLYGIGIIIIVMLIFSAGIAVGVHKASFGRAWGEHYNENFGIGHRNGGIGNVGQAGMMDYFPNANGAVGKIIKVVLPNIIVQDEDNIEKTILIASDTKIQKGKDSIASTDLKINDFIIVIGTPNNQGAIEAKFIRLVPSPEFLQ